MRLLLKHTVSSKICVQPMGAEGGDHTKVYVEVLNFKLFFRKYIAAPSFIFKQVCS